MSADLAQNPKVRALLLFLPAFVVVNKVTAVAIALIG